MIQNMSEVAAREARQQEIFEIVPQHGKEIERHKKLMEQEQARLVSTGQRVQNLEGDHAELLSEVRKLRKGLELNQEYWKGFSRGLKETKKTVHQEGDGEMLPSATRLRNALPALRPATHTG